MRVAILGFSDQEQSESMPIYRYFKAKGAEITAFYWGEPQLPEDVHKVKIDKNTVIENLEGFDLIVRGPAIHPRQVRSDTPVTSLTDIFVKESPSKNIIGVTGTKGKGTTSTLIAKLLEAQGRKVWLGGNIGKPLLDDLSEIKPDDWVVLEMSAGQLITFTGRVHIGVCLMVVPEHLDWHTDLQEYTDAKANLFKHQTSDDIAIFFADNPVSVGVASNSLGKKIPYYQRPGAYVREDGMVMLDETEIIPKSEVKLLGEHNLQNICAALTAVYEAAGGLDKAKAVLHSFSGLEHRLELVREFEGVKYYDDSFGTTPETAVVALAAFNQPKVVILGGHDKDIPFDKLADKVSNNNVRHAVLIGDTAPKLEELLKERGFSNYSLGLKTMPEIVTEAKKNAQPGDVVLLSTGCASFGLFKDYKDRGNQFKQVVQALA
jgi:UDP-N-acetylmuramoylalanine--D-glutamate ligase